MADGLTCAVVRSLKRRRWGGPELLAYRGPGSGAPPGGHDVTARLLRHAPAPAA